MTGLLGPPLVEALDGLDLTHMVTVPGSGLQPLYEAFAFRHPCLFASKEEEAVAIACGLALSGSRPVVVMQQAGVGNSLNAVFTLADSYRIRFPIIVCDRGPNDENPVQRDSSRNTSLVLRALDAEIVDLPGEGVKRVREAVSARKRWILCRAADAGVPC